MLHVPVAAKGLPAYNAMLASSHTVDFRVELLDLDHNKIADISGITLGGQVDGDLSAQSGTERTMSLTVLDPDYRLGLDSPDPIALPTYLRRMIKVWHVAKGPNAGDQPVAVPVFTGPVVDVDRKDEVITLTCHGKETLVRKAVHGAKTWPKGAFIYDAVVGCLNAGGEVLPWLDLDWSAKRFAAPYSVGPDTDLWAAAQGLAKQLGMALFYDSNGIARMEVAQSSPVFTIRHGAGGHLVSLPKRAWDAADLVTRVVATGKVPDGSNARVPRADFLLPATYPLSPMNVKRHGVRIAFTETMDSDATTQYDVEAEAHRHLLDRAALDEAGVELTCFPIPHLELRDRVRVEAEGLGMDFDIKAYSFPLGHDEMMSIGARRLVNRRPMLKNWPAPRRPKPTPVRKAAPKRKTAAQTKTRKRK